MFTSLLIAACKNFLVLGLICGLAIVYSSGDLKVEKIKKNSMYRDQLPLFTCLSSNQKHTTIAHNSYIALSNQKFQNKILSQLVMGALL